MRLVLIYLFRDFHMYGSVSESRGDWEQSVYGYILHCLPAQERKVVFLHNINNFFSYIELFLIYPNNIYKGPHCTVINSFSTLDINSIRKGFKKYFSKLFYIRPKNCLLDLLGPLNIKRSTVSSAFHCSIPSLFSLISSESQSNKLKN